MGDIDSPASLAIDLRTSDPDEEGKGELVAPHQAEANRAKLGQYSKRLVCGWGEFHLGGAGGSLSGLKHP